MKATTETCANCDARIGRLETPHLWGDRIVCGACHAKLSKPAGAQTDPAGSSAPLNIYTDAEVSIASNVLNFSGTTYPLSALTSVSMHILQRPKPADYSWVAGIFGGLMVFVGFICIVVNDSQTPTVAPGIVILLVGGGMAFVAARAFRENEAKPDEPPVYYVRITTAAGEVDVVGDTNADRIRKIVAAINVALALGTV